MIEHQNIDGRDVWLKVDPHPANRENPNIIPTEYFTATYYTQEPLSGPITGETVTDDDGTPKLFESPVAALTFAWKRLKGPADRKSVV